MRWACGVSFGLRGSEKSAGSVLAGAFGKFRSGSRAELM
jgi:hypothetical protein